MCKPLSENTTDCHYLCDKGFYPINNSVVDYGCQGKTFARVQPNAIRNPIADPCLDNPCDEIENGTLAYCKPLTGLTRECYFNCSDNYVHIDNDPRNNCTSKVKCSEKE